MFDDASVPSIIAGILTILNSVILAWFQLEKPYDRWRLYRKYHRLAEAERVKFLNQITPYDIPNSGKKLIEHLSDMQVRLHYEWDGLIPSNEDIQGLHRGR